MLALGMSVTKENPKHIQWCNSQSELQDKRTLKFHSVCMSAQSCMTLWCHGLQLSRLFSPWNFPGKNTGVGCHFPASRDQTHVSCISCTGRQILYHCITREAQFLQFSSVQSLSHVRLFVTADSMDCGTPCFPVHHQLPEFIHSCPLSGWCHPTISSSAIPFSSLFNLSQHHGLFQWVISSHEVAKVLEFQLQHQSFQWIFRTNFL